MEKSKKIDNKRLSIIRETELLHSFVRVNIKENASSVQSEEPEILENNNKDNEQRRIRQTPMSAGTSRRLAKEITATETKSSKKKHKKIPPREEEIYCDKDRAAAVNLGTKDIKQSLKIKRKQDRSKCLHLPEEAEPSTFLALGNYELCRGDVEIAINFISKALELNPIEKNSLVARSKCYILLGQSENALKDAESALNVDKTFIKAIYQKAEALYYLGDFEHSLMFFHRGLHLRPDHQDFKLGVQKSQKAIENAIGSIRKKTDGDNNKNNNSSNNGTISSITTLSSSSALTQKKSTIISTIRKKPSHNNNKLLLGELAADKEYLDNLMMNPDIKCKFPENDDKIEKCIKETLQYLNGREEFWRQQLPRHLK